MPREWAGGGGRGGGGRQNDGGEKREARRQGEGWFQKRDGRKGGGKCRRDVEEYSSFQNNF